MAQAQASHRRLQGQILSSPRSQPSHHRLGEVRGVRARAWGENAGSDGPVVGRGDQCSHHWQRSAKARVYAQKKTYGYQERDEQQRQQFIQQLCSVSETAIVYADESGMDNREDYGYGYCPKGERYHALKSGHRTGRINMIAAWCNQQLLAPFTIEGSCNRLVFETWLERCLIPELKPGQVLVIDNASFHKGERIQALVEAASCQLWYLPPYSPDLNLIEHCWSWLKSRIRHQLPLIGDLREAMEHVLREASCLN